MATTDPTTSATETEPNPPAGNDQTEILAKVAEFAQLIPQQANETAPQSMDYLRDVPLVITAQLGHVTMPIGDVLKLGPGAVVELEEAIDQPVRLSVRGVPFATAEVVVVEDRFAVRIKSLLPPRSTKG